MLGRERWFIKDHTVREIDTMGNRIKTVIALMLRAEANEYTLLAFKGKFVGKIWTEERIGSTSKNPK